MGRKMHAQCPLPAGGSHSPGVRGAVLNFVQEHFMGHQQPTLEPKYQSSTLKLWLGGRTSAKM